MSNVSTNVLNNKFIDKIVSDDSVTRKSASDEATNFTRGILREEGFLRKILPPRTISNSELTKLPHTDKLCYVKEKEPDSPAAVSVPFGMQPIAEYIKQPRYAIAFQRIMTPKFVKDVDELRTYDMDIRQVLSDNAVKDMMAEEDGKFLAAANHAMGIRDNAASNETGIATWNSTTNALNRSSLAEARKFMPRTRARLEPAKALTNSITIKELEKWQRDQIGGDLAQDMLVDSFSERKFAGMEWMITIKHDLVAEGSVYFWAEPKFLGENLQLEDVVLFIERRSFFIEFYAYKLGGAAIGNVAGVSRTDFLGTFTATNN